MRGQFSYTFFIVVLLTIISAVVYRRAISHNKIITQDYLNEDTVNQDTTATMPLVDALTSKPKDKNEEWQNKLVGKKLSEEGESNETVFSKRDLPEGARVIAPGDIVTKDFRMDRLNVHLKEDGSVSHVRHG